MTNDNKAEEVTPETTEAPKLPTSGLATAALVTGILSVLLFLVPGVHFILSTLAIIFGAIKLRKNRYAAAGLILGIVSWGLVTVYWVGWIAIGIGSSAAAL